MERSAGEGGSLLEFDGTIVLDLGGDCIGNGSFSLQSHILCSFLNIYDSSKLQAAKKNISCIKFLSRGKHSQVHIIKRLLGARHGGACL